MQLHVYSASFTLCLSSDPRAEDDAAYLPNDVTALAADDDGVEQRPIHPMVRTADAAW